jgi:hypothetical protein
MPMVLVLLAGCTPTPAALPGRESPPARVVPRTASRTPSASPTAVLSAPVSVPPDGTLPALYAPLFESGHVWRMRVTFEKTMIDADGRTPMFDVSGKARKERSASVLSCKVESVSVEVYGISSQIECDGLMESESPVVGQWVATRDGLFHAEMGDGLDTNALSPESAYLLAAPVPFTTNTPSVDDPTTVVSSLSLTRDGDGFCRSRRYWTTPSGTERVCFAPAEGIVGGSYGYAGKVVYETEFRTMH